MLIHNVIEAGENTRVNQDIINALSSVSSRFLSIEHRISKTEVKLQQQSLLSTCHSEEPLEATQGRSRTSSSEVEMIVPPMSILKGSNHIQK